DCGECGAGRARGGAQEYLCVGSPPPRSGGVPARGGGVTRAPPSRGGQRPRAPVPAPEEGPRWPQRAKERANGSSRLPVAGGVSPRLIATAHGVRGVSTGHSEPQLWHTTFAETQDCYARWPSSTGRNSFGALSARCCRPAEGWLWSVVPTYSWGFWKRHFDQPPGGGFVPWPRWKNGARLCGMDRAGMPRGREAGHGDRHERVCDDHRQATLV